MRTASVVSLGGRRMDPLSRRILLLHVEVEGASVPALLVRIVQVDVLVGGSEASLSGKMMVNQHPARQSGKVGQISLALGSSLRKVILKRGDPSREHGKAVSASLARVCGEVLGESGGSALL